MKSSILMLIVIFALANTVSQAQQVEIKSILAEIIKYDMDIELNYENKKLHSVCRMKLLNPTDITIDSISLLLYRLMKVSAITDNHGTELRYSQQIMTWEDWDLMQTNYISIQLDDPILPHETKEINVTYSGYLRGYTETGMNYVKDNISEDFTIIRPDSYAYPLIGIPNDEKFMSLKLPNFDYRFSITVPDSLCVANGGKLIDKKLHNRQVTYTYESIKPSWRIDIAVADYKMLSRDEFKVYYFAKDSIGAQNVFEAWGRTIKLFSDWWGPLVDFKGFSIIEVPVGYGSQSDVTSIIQDEVAFKGQTEMDKLYHEVSHLWNVKSNDKYPSRWEEGLAMFIQFLAQKELDGIDKFEGTTNWAIKNICRDENYLNTAFIDYGKEKLTDNSYILGIVLFQVFYELVGEEEFHSLFKGFYNDFRENGATIKEFLNYANKQTKRNLDSFYQDWFYTANYSILMKQGYSIADFVKLYNK